MKKAHELYVEVLSCSILDYDPKEFAEKFYDYGLGNGLILKIELYGVDDDNLTCSESVFKTGTGSHSKGYFDYKGEKYSFHFSCSDDFRAYSLNSDLEKFKDLYTVEINNWIHELEQHEKYLQTTSDIEQSISDAENIDQVVIPSHRHFNVELIQDELKDKFDTLGGLFG